VYLAFVWQQATQIFDNITNISDGLKLANNTVTKIEVTGDVKIKAFVNGEEKNIRLKETHYTFPI